MTRKLVLLGALSFFVGLGVIVASFVASPVPIIASKMFRSEFCSELIVLLLFQP